MMPWGRNDHFGAGKHFFWASHQRCELRSTLCVWSQLEEELKAQIEMWEQEHSKAFVVNGQKFMEYVAEQWEMYRLEKERAKQERVRGPSLGRGRGGPVGSPDSTGAHGVEVAPDFCPHAHPRHALFLVCQCCF